MINFKLKKRIAIFVLTSSMLFFLNECICFGGENTSRDSLTDLNYITQEQEKPGDTQEEGEQDYLTWKNKYDETEKTMKKSKTLNTIGLITMTSSVVILFFAVKKETKGGGTIVMGGSSRHTTQAYTLPKVEEQKLNTGLAIAGASLLAVGAGLAIAATLRSNKAKKQKKALEEEGKIKGYFDLKLDPITKSYAISYTLKF